MTTSISQEAPSIDGLVAKIHSMIGWALLGDQRRTHIGRAEVFFSRRTMHAEHPDRCREAEDEVDEYEVILRNTPDSGIEEADEVCIFYRDHKLVYELVYELRREINTWLPAKMAAEVDELGERGLQWVYAQIITPRKLTIYEKADQLFALVKYGTGIKGDFPVLHTPELKTRPSWVQETEGKWMIYADKDRKLVGLENNAYEMFVSRIGDALFFTFNEKRERRQVSNRMVAAASSVERMNDHMEYVFHDVLDSIANLAGYQWR